MASLLDKVLDNKDNPEADKALSPQVDNSHKLPDGAVVFDSTIAAVNRVFELNPNLHKRQTLAGEYELYDKNRRITLDSEYQILQLIRGDWKPRTKYQLAWFKEKVLELAPIVSFDFYAVTDSLIWDKNEAKLKRVSDDDNIRTVS